MQPSPGNPLGNPSSYKGHTASNGPNFIMYLTTKYNKSSIQTYDFAWAGSPVAGMVGQIEKAFVPYFTGHGKLDPGWDPAKTLFALFVGINDLDHWYLAYHYHDHVFTNYTGALETVSNKMHFLYLHFYQDPVLIPTTSFTRKAPATSSSTPCRPSTKAPNSKATKKTREPQSTITTAA